MPQYLPRPALDAAIDAMWATGKSAHVCGPRWFGKRTAVEEAAKRIDGEPWRVLRFEFPWREPDTWERAAVAAVRGASGSFEAELASLVRREPRLVLLVDAGHESPRLTQWETFVLRLLMVEDTLKRWPDRLRVAVTCSLPVADIEKWYLRPYLLSRTALLDAGPVAPVELVRWVGAAAVAALEPLLLGHPYLWRLVEPGVESWTASPAEVGDANGPLRGFFELAAQALADEEGGAWRDNLRLLATGRGAATVAQRSAGLVDAAGRVRPALLPWMTAG